MSTIASLSWYDPRLLQCHSDGTCDQRHDLLLIEVHRCTLLRRVLTKRRLSTQPRSATIKAACFIRDLSQNIGQSRCLCVQHKTERSCTGGTRVSPSRLPVVLRSRPTKPRHNLRSSPVDWALHTARASCGLTPRRRTSSAGGRERLESPASLKEHHPLISK